MSNASDKEIRLPGVCAVTKLLNGRKIGNDVSVIRQTLAAQTTKTYQVIPREH